MSDLKEKNEDKEKEGQGKEEETQHELDDILGQLKESKDAESKKAEEKSEPSEPSIAATPPASMDKPEPEGLDQILETIHEQPEEVPVEEMNFLQRIIGIFTSPGKVFEYLKVKPDFAIPVILAILIAVMSGYLVYDIALNDRITTIEDNDRIPDERKELIIDQIESSRQGVQKYIYSLVLPAVFVLIIYTIVTAIFLLIGNVFLGGKASFKQIFSAYSYSYLIVILVGTVVKLPLMLMRQTLKIDTSPAVFLPQSQMDTTLYSFVSGFDVFNLWFVVVFGLGFAIIYGFSKPKGIISVIIAWLLYIVIFQVWLGNLFKGFTG